jgi:cytochrome c biogenesis protein CcmG, thiol:disulfide interchange protein DsbE
MHHEPDMPMNPPPPATPSSPRLGLAVASLVLGIIALLSSVLVIGALFGLVGLILGIAHFMRRQGRNGLAWAGVIMSVLGIVASVALAAAYVPMARKVMEELRSGDWGPDQNAFAEWQGVLAPDFSVTTLDGQTIQLSELKGKRVVLDFWATWCPPCVMEIPHFIKLRAENPADELVLVGISSEDENTLKAFVKKKGINYPIASADDLPEPYSDVTSIPTTFFLDRNGVIQSVLVGYHDFDVLESHARAKDFEGEALTQPRPLKMTPTEDEPEQE